MGVLAAWKRLLVPIGSFVQSTTAADAAIAEAARRPDNGQRFRLAFQQNPIPMAVVGPDLRFHAVNAAMSRLFGYSEAELQSLTVNDLAYPDDGAHNEGDGPAPTCAGVPSFRLEKRYRTRTGETLWGGLTVTLVHNAAGAVQFGLAMIEDITERRRMEEALRNALEFRERVLAADANAISVIDAGGKFILASHRVVEISGYSQQELLGNTFGMLLPEWELPRVSEKIEATLSRGAALQFEMELLRKDGTIRIVNISMQPLVLEGGLAGAIGTAEDITERRQAEQALRNSEDRHRDLVEHSGVLIGTHDLDGNILSANQSLVRLIGCSSAEELIGTSIGQLLAPTVRQLFPAYLERMRDAGRAQGAMKILTRSGDERIVEYDNSVRQEGLTTPIVRCFGRDVTEQKCSARALRASEARYRALYEDNPAMYFTVDPAGIILSVNQFGAGQLGYTAHELVGQSVLQVFHYEDRDQVMLQMTACLETPAAVAHWEFRKVRRDGSILWVHEAARAVTNAGGRTEVLIVCEDVTERRRTEQALRDSEARLRALSDNVPNGAVYQIIQQLDGRVHFPYMSAGIKQMMGVSAQETMQNARALLDLVVEEDQQRVRAAFQESMRSLSVVDMEVRMRSRSGQVKWIHYRSAPRRLADGGTLWDGVQVDVTDARRDLEALLQTVGAIIWEGEGSIAADAVRRSFVNQQAERLLGYPISDWLEKPTFWLEHIHPEDQANVRAVRRSAINTRTNYEIDYRMNASDGRIVWLRDIVNVVVRDDQRLKLRGITVDITASKQAEAALCESKKELRQSHERTRELAGRLMLTQEEERRRISRELHDDVNQQVAALAIAVSRLRQELPESAAAQREQLRSLQDRMMALSEDVRRVSHQLHPAALEHIGLVAALRSHCAEFSSHENIVVTISIRDGDDAIPPDIALCLYRVTQESLRNIAKHARTREARVTLGASAGVVSLSIADAGVGFDLEQVKEQGGLGLVSMEERVRLLRGVLQISTRPHGGGTVVQVHLPLHGE